MPAPCSPSPRPESDPAPSAAGPPCPHTDPQTLLRGCEGEGGGGSGLGLPSTGPFISHCTKRQHNLWGSKTVETLWPGTTHQGPLIARARVRHVALETRVRDVARRHPFRCCALRALKHGVRGCLCLFRGPAHRPVSRGCDGWRCSQHRAHPPPCPGTGGAGSPGLSLGLWSAVERQLPCF